MLKYIKYFILIFFLCNFIHISEANTATISATSCSQSDVQAAVNSASDGDTVLVPSGNCTWSSVVTVPSSKGLYIVGAGINQTIIKDGTGSSSNVLQIYSAYGKPFRVTAITFDGNGVSKSGTYAQIYVSGDCQNFRIDNCKLDNLKGRGIITHAGGNELYGVIDHCTFIAPYSVSVQGISVFGAGPQDGSAWTRDEDFGTSKFIYIEDCTFNYSYNNDGALDAYGGGRYVFRYNNVTGTGLGHHGCDSGNYRSTYVYEIYENTFTTSYDIFRLWRSRGGTGVVYNNTATGSYSGMYLSNYRSAGSYGVWGQCDGNNPLDGNTDPYGYPCLDQVGRGKNQTNSPVYEWGNTINGSDVDLTIASYGGNVIIEGRDYYNDTQMPGYTAYTYPHPLTGASPPPGDGPPAPPANVHKK